MLLGLLCPNVTHFGTDVFNVCRVNVDPVILVLLKDKNSADHILISHVKICKYAVIVTVDPFR